MIESFKCDETEWIFNRGYSRKIPGVIQRAALRKLWLIDSATNLNDLRVPTGNRFELLKGKRAGQYSVRINDQWRVCFKWRNGNAYDVEIVDYH